MIRHIVAWNFRDEFTEDENYSNAIRVKYELENLKNLISLIVEIRVDINLSSTSNRSIMLNSLFHSEEDLAKYQVHPEHERVCKLVGSVMKDRVCLDFYESNE